MNKKFINFLLRLKLFSLASLVASVSSILNGGFRLKYIDGLWLYYFGDMKIYDKILNYNVTKSAFKYVMENVYFKQYTPQNGDICIDVGSGIGTETIVMSKLVGEKGFIHSIEAFPDTFHILEKNVQTNNCNNVICHQLAIADKNDILYMELNEDEHIKNKINSEFKSNSLRVEGVTMDTFILNNNIKSIDYLKVNIEGAEQLLIKKFDCINMVKNIAISCHDFLGQRQNDSWLFTKEKIIQFLAESNFELFFNDTEKPYANDWVFGRNRNFYDG